MQRSLPSLTDVASVARPVVEADPVMLGLGELDQVAGDERTVLTVSTGQSSCTALISPGAPSATTSVVRLPRAVRSRPSSSQSSFDSRDPNCTETSCLRPFSSIPGADHALLRAAGADREICVGTADEIGVIERAAFERSKRSCSSAQILATVERDSFQPRLLHTTRCHASTALTNRRSPTLKDRSESRLQCPSNLGHERHSGVARLRDLDLKLALAGLNAGDERCAAPPRSSSGRARAGATLVRARPSQPSNSSSTAR